MATSGSEQQLRFRWNDHLQHISKVLTLQRLEEQFCDVTLVTEDGFVMKAHQAILASSSGYFQRVFSEISNDQYPMVVLRNANFREMSCLLDYMYQGSTQVHQSLMESVLEVADILEVKGLSQIRSNNTIKKFIGPAPASSTASTNAAPAHPGDNTRDHSRSPDEHCRSHSPDEQLYQDSLSRGAELDNAWMRFQGNVVSENRSKDSGHPHVEGHLTEEPQPSTHTRGIACQDSNSQVVHEESQMSGIDLSMAKNEPWSPKESPLNEDKNSPSRKRRKLLESLCSDETLEPVSDPDWGRIGSKIDERAVCQPRIISFSSIATSESRTYFEEGSFIDENSQEYKCKPPSLSPPVPLFVYTGSKYVLPLNCCGKSSSTDLNVLNMNSNQKAEQSSTGSSFICSCKQPNQTKFSENKAQQLAYTRKNKFSKRTVQKNLNSCSESTETHYHNKNLQHRTTLEETVHQDANSNERNSYEFSTSKGSSDGRQSHTSEKENSSGMKLRRDGSYSGEEHITLRESAVNAIDNPVILNIHKSTGAEFKEDYLKNEESKSCKPGSTTHPVKSEGNHMEVTKTEVISEDDQYVVIIKDEILEEDPTEGDDMNLSPVLHTTLDSAHNISQFSKNISDLEDDEPHTSSASDPVPRAKICTFVNVQYKKRFLARQPESSQLSCPLEKKLRKPSHAIKRPLNSFMLFQREIKEKTMAEHPGEPYQATLKRIAQLWRELSGPERMKWQSVANTLKDEHKRQNPDYRYSPKEAGKRRLQYLKERYERKHLYRIAADDDISLVSPNFYRTLT